jgi:hypothetical protein
VWLFVKTAFLVSTLILFYRLNHLLPLALFQQNTTPMNFYLGRTFHAQKRFATGVPYVGTEMNFPRSVWGHVILPVKTEGYGCLDKLLLA